MLGIVGNTSIIDCDVNGDYYAEQGYYPIIAGVAQACFTSPNFSAVNMGPYYSSLGGAQAALRAGATGKMVVVSPNLPGFDLINSGVVDFAEENGLEGVSILEDVPIADPAGFAQRLVQEAGEGGGVVLDFTGPAVLPLLQAIEQQGLVDSVIWASSTPPNDPSVAEALEPGVGRQVPRSTPSSTCSTPACPDQNHMHEVREQYAPDFPVSSFAQMGYLAGKVATDALLGIEGDITKESVNEAFRGVTNFASDILCKPWYFDSTAGGNVSNNTDFTVVAAGTADGAARGLLRHRRAARATRWTRSGRPKQELGLNTPRLSVDRDDRRSGRPRTPMPDACDELKPFLVIGLALGGVYAMSGVGLVVLYRATGVLNLFYGAVGARAP